MKLNLGCGFKKLEAYHNVDQAPTCEPDLVHDLTSVPWPFKQSSIEEFRFDYSLEQMGSSPKDLIAILTEVYRLAKSNAVVRIECWHPRHDRFILNPFCVHRLSPQFFQRLSKSQNINEIGQGVLDDSIALTCDLDFDLVKGVALIAGHFQKQVEKGETTVQELVAQGAHANNIFESYSIELRVNK